MLIILVDAQRLSSIPGLPIRIFQDAPAEARNAAGQGKDKTHAEVDREGIPNVGQENAYCREVA